MVDTHCHLDLDPLLSRLPEVLESARRAGVTRFVVPGVHPGGWERMALLASSRNGVFPAFGIHPMHADKADDASLSRLAAIAPSAVAIGEIGLDPNYAVSMELQERAFREQLRLAVSLGLPVLVHCRRAFLRTRQILVEEKAARTGGIMHAFSGSVEMAWEFIRLGFLISISGTVTRTNAIRPVGLARELPLESLVLETDAPDMTPQRFRGEPNQPAYLTEVLRCVALIRGLRPEDVARQTTRNAASLLSIRGACRRC
ncbi:MAG: TatD family hydrolase [Deltaproteobacteria bacterium]|nr:TatD family hydrolase [Deltaproteobacteria bacterium]